MQLLLLQSHRRLAFTAQLMIVLVSALVGAMFAPRVLAFNVNCYLGSIEFFDTTTQPPTVIASSPNLLYPNVSYDLPLARLSFSSIGEVRYTFFDDLNPSNADVTLWINNVQTDFRTLVNATEVVMPITGLPTQCGQSTDVHFFINQTEGDAFRLDECAYDWIFRLIPPCIVGDPQFAGLRGQSFQVHGIDGAVYSLISAPTYAVNARFDFLDGPRPCAVMPSTNERSVACWSHPGSYLGSVGVVTQSGESILFEAGSAASGFDNVTLNAERELAVGERVELAGQMGFLERISTHEAVLKVGSFEMELESNDEFINLRAVRVSPEEWKLLARQRVHGLLGQTWQLRRYSGSIKEIEGEVDDYVVEDNNVLGHDFVFSRFSSVQLSA